MLTFLYSIWDTLVLHAALHLHQPQLLGACVQAVHAKQQGGLAAGLDAAAEAALEKGLQVKLAEEREQRKMLQDHNAHLEARLRTMEQQHQYNVTSLMQPSYWVAQGPGQTLLLVPLPLPGTARLNDEELKARHKEWVHNMANNGISERDAITVLRSATTTPQGLVRLNTICCIDFHVVGGTETAVTAMSTVRQACAYTSHLAYLMTTTL